MPKDTEIRLQLFLARCGIASRRNCADIIADGRVTVNGKMIQEPYFKVNPDVDTVQLDEETIKISKFKFYKMYKPIGYLSALGDERGRKTVADLIPQKLGKLFYVGRLDLNSEGLLILTNHGEAANRISHPRYHFPKVYHAVLNKSPDRADLIKISKGIMLNGKKTMPGAYELIGKSNSNRVRVEIMEGRKRQIRMVFREMDYRVTALKRLSIGPIKLGHMKPGEIKEFSMDELFELLGAIGLRSM